MRKNFGPAAQADAPKTTARELANELAASANHLKESANALRAEIANIDKAKGEIEEERDAAIKTFVKTTLPDLQSDQFDVLSEMAQQTAAVGGQSLSFLRQKMIEGRDAALQEVNAGLDTTVDADTFHQTLTEAKAKLAQASGAYGQASSAAQSAQLALAAWQNTKEYSFEALSDDVAKKGSPSLTADNRAYYEPKNLISASYLYAKNGPEYRAVRDALVEYGHEQNGKDLFAEMAFIRAKTEQLTKAVTDTEAALAAVVQEKSACAATVNKFSGAERRIVTDAQILEALQGKVVQYLAVADFAKAAAEHYAEDFPKNAAMMTAKLTVLDKLEMGAQEKLQGIDASVVAITRQYTQINKLKSYTELNVDLAQVRRQNAARKAEYDNYTTATRDSWSRTRTYNTRDVVYVDNSPSMLEWYLIMNMMNDHHHHNHGTPGFVPTPTSSYTAEMLKLDRDEARTSGIPDSAFEISADVTRQMQDIGVTDFDRAGAFTFNADTAVNDNASQGSDGFSFNVDKDIDDAVASVREAAPVQQSTYSGGSSNSNSGGGFSFNTDREPAREPARETSRSWEPSPTPSSFGRSS